MKSKPFIVHFDRDRSYFARSEISRNPDRQTREAADPVEEIFAKCERCMKLTSGFTAWSDRAAPTLEAALPLRRHLKANPEAFHALQARPAMQDRKRMLSLKKLDLACIYACHAVATVGDRKECSKFAKVLAAADASGIEPSKAAAWLKTITLTGIVSKSAKSRSPATFAVSLDRSAFPLLAMEIANSKSPLRARVMETMEKAARRCEALLHEALTSGETPTNNSKGATHA